MIFVEVGPLRISSCWLVYSEVASLVDKSYVVDMVLLDFSTEFDVLLHMLLLQKLCNIDINASLLN